MHQKAINSETAQRIDIVLSLDDDGSYSVQVWVNEEMIGSSTVIGGFLAAYELSQEILWNYDSDAKSPWT